MSTATAPCDRIKRMAKKSRQAKEGLWQRIQLEEPAMAGFMKEAQEKLGARATEIKLNGKVVWKS